MWERLLARLFIGEPVPALTNDFAYPAILVLELGEVVSYGYILGKGYCTYQWPCLPGDIVS